MRSQKSILMGRKQKRKSFEEHKYVDVKGTNNNKRFLININVLGSAGPIRFVVNEGDLIAHVIDTALKTYARQARLPRLGSDLNQFHLYCANYGAALGPWELIGSSGGRNFVLCKKQMIEAEAKPGEDQMLAQKGCISWKIWFNKSFINFKILSH